jgi:hypothetical protein
MRRIEGCRWETECYEMSVMRVALKQGKKQWTRVEDEDWMWSCRAADVATCKTPNTRDNGQKACGRAVGRRAETFKAGYRVSDSGESDGQRIREIWRHEFSDTNPCHDMVWHGMTCL